MKNRGWLVGVAGVAWALAGCGERSPTADDGSSSGSGSVSTMDWEMQWAQAALERNPNVEIIQADRDQRTFVVRDRHNAMTAEVQLAQIAAAPIEFLGTATGETPPPQTVAPADPNAVTRLADNANQPEAQDEETEPQAPADPVPAQPKSPSYTVERSGGRTRIIGDGIRVEYGEPDTRGALSFAGTTRDEPSDSVYTVDRSSGVVRIHGPGVSIEGSSEPRAVAFGQSLENAEIEPVVCEGPRVMQLDNRVIHVEGDALTARGGCELYITNSTIVASGTAVVIADATVHINNSRIEGRLAPFEARQRAKVFLRGSTLNGLPRRDGQALIQDQGGNRYQ